MPQQIVISEQLRIAALLTDERIDELIVAQGRYQIGDVFLGTVENVLPGIDAAFVNIGESEKNGFIHVSDLGPLRLKEGAAGITELLEPRQKVLVQVMKEPTGNKGPRLTGNLSLPGRYLILQPNGQGVNISRRINTESERNRLRALGVLVKPPSTGVLIRTEAEGINEDLLIDDLENLLKQWELIQQASETCNPPILLNRDEDFIHRILRDHVSPSLNKIIVENNSDVERIRKFLGSDKGEVAIQVHNESSELLEYYRINSAINNALKPRVELPSGGYIIIEPTEALTVIDVNSGSFTRSANSRETVLWTNCEAAVEIARQLKLRNIGGVIIIDFIDMDSRRDQLQLLEHFTSSIKNDSARPQIAQLTELGLVELTRKRQGQNIYELFGKTCPNCSGKGHITNLPGKEQIQPLANVSGYIPTSNNHQKENNTIVENDSHKKKRSQRNREQEINAIVEDNENNHETDNTNSSESSQEESSIETFQQKQETEIISIKINSEEELVFSSLGFNPILLNENLPETENYIVQIVRPGEDENTIIKEAQEKLAMSSTKKRKKGKIVSRISHKSEVALNISTNEEMSNHTTLNKKEEETINIDSSKIQISEEVIEQKDNIKTIEEEKEDSSIENQEQVDDPRRRRRRSSASV